MALVLSRETTLQDAIGGLERESGFLGAMWQKEMALGAALLLPGLVVGFLYRNWWLAGLGGILVFLGFGHWLKIRDNVRDVGRFQGGAEGEAKVSAILEKGLPDTYWILNDISVRSGSRSAQNDHIVLGPNGIFVIETKAYSGSLSGAATDDQLTQEKNFKGKVTANSIKNPIPQNEYHCEIVKERMKDIGLAVEDVHSVIVFTNKWVKLRIQDSPVPVVKPEYLCATILKHPSRYGYDAAWLGAWVRGMAPGVEPPPASAAPGGEPGPGLLQA